MPARDEAPKRLLEDVRIVFVQSRSLTNTRIFELKQLVKKHGADVLDPDDKGKIKLAKVTHIVSNTVDFEEYHESQSQMKPVIQDSWITTSINRGKLAQVRPYSPDPRLIMSNVTVTCADLPDTDKDSILGATLALGGMESKDITRLTTHVCALSLDHPKVKMVLSKGLRCKVVLPHWFDDCFKLGKRIDETPYMLQNPTVTELPLDSYIATPHTQHLEGATHWNPNAELDVNDAGGRNLVLFSLKKVMLSSDLHLRSRLRHILQRLITNNGGTVVNSALDCDWYICQFREGPDYISASQQGKVVGNLSWLFHLIVHNEWTSPLRRLLHYPIPRNGINGFEGVKIAISNYGGDARIYLENLIEACGAIYTKSMKSENKFLITARLNGDKYDAAKDWNIEVLNHLWIEESYAKCRMQPLTLPKYTTFPRQTNLGEIIGQTSFDEDALRATFFPSEDSSGGLATRKRKSSQTAQMNTSSATGCGGRHFEVRQDGSSSPTTAKPGRAARVTQAVRDCSTPAKNRRASAGKENDASSIASGGSRSAKAQALSKLQDLAPDIALYEKEKKRTVGHGPWGGKRAADQIDRNWEGKKGSSPAHNESDEMQVDEEEENRRLTKRPKSSMTPVQMRICLTGYKLWVGDRLREDQDRRKLRNLGIQIVDQASPSSPCDYLAAPGLLRTIKFLCALARGPEVISCDFIDACLEAKKLLDPSGYPLKHSKSEGRIGFDIKKAVSRARQSRGRVLLNVPVYCTADIKNGVEAYEQVAKANGAIFRVYRARSGTTIKPTSPEEDGDLPPEPVYLLTYNTPSEMQLWPRFEEMARKGNMEPRVVSYDWLLDVALMQELVFEPEHHLAVNAWKK